MTGDFDIRDLQGLLGPYIGPKQEIAKTEMCRLTGPGENYGSIMLKLDVTLRDVETGQEKVLNAVAKTPPDEEMTRKIFNCAVTCKTEAAVYTTMVPALREFQREVGVERLIDWSADVYGARINLNGSDVVDQDACLVLENLQVSGFANGSRRDGFDFETAKMVLKSLADFHAVPLAYKLSNPKGFEANVKSFCKGLVPPFDIMDEFLRRLLDENEKYRNMFPNAKVWPTKSAPREPFATITHGDLWTNNTMQRFADGKPAQNKIVDFQALDYGSPASDVYFFLFTSLNKPVLEQHFDDLLQYYHENFVRVLEAHGCDTKPFSYEAFLEEMKAEGKNEFGHTLVFSLILRQSEESKRESANQQGPPSIDVMVQSVTDHGRDQFCYIADVCIERGWHP